MAFVMDRFMGDPPSFPHPVVFIGKLISFLESILRKIMPPLLGGVVLVFLVTSSTFIVTYYIADISGILEVLIIYTIFAARCLAVEAMKVQKALVARNIGEARIAISYLVSRDTDDMTEEEIIKATVETVSENIVDGITAPLFYLFLGGAAAGMTYKAINTMDSMVGYKNEKYIKFGKAAARLDDLANFIPARITGALIIPIAAFFARLDARASWKVFFRDRLNHSSPNSAHSESAIAGALGVQLGGDTSYFGKVTEKPHIGDFKKKLSPNDIAQTVKLMYYSSIIALVMGMIIYTLLELI